MEFFNQLLMLARKNNISDVHLKSGMVPIFRQPGGLTGASNSPLGAEDLDKLILGLLGEEGFREYKETGEADLAYSAEGAGRVRVNCYQDRGKPALAIRLIAPAPPSLEQLELPPAAKRLGDYKDGLIIVAGPTGSGKSTTLAGVLKGINSTRPVHIVTIEDPIEYVHENIRAMITQREIGTDTQSFKEALRRVLRQDPDVIVIGEIRDAETLKTALAAAETGHLVYATLHTVSAKETITRMLEMVPAAEQTQIRHMLSGILRAVAVQRMLPRKNDEGRIVAQELLFDSGRVKEAIGDEEKFNNLDQIIKESQEQHGMQTFDQALVELVKQDKISPATALDFAPNPRNFRLELHQALGYDPYSQGEQNSAASRIRIA